MKEENKEIVVELQNLCDTKYRTVRKQLIAWNHCKYG